MTYEEVLENTKWNDVVAGIYSIQNTINGKKYIGLSSNIYSRWRHHARADGSCTAIHAAINKYGIASFDFSILEVCEVSELHTKEIEHIASNNSMFPNGYNLTSGGDGARDITEHTKEITRQRMLEQWSDPEWRERALEAMNTPEVKAAKAAATRKRYEDASVREAHSEKLRERWSDAEYKEKTVASVREVWDAKTDEERKCHGDKSRDTWNRMSEDEQKAVVSRLTRHRQDPERNAEVGAKIKAALNRPEVKEKRGKAISEALQQPERKAHRSKTTKARWEDPEWRQKSSAGIKASWSTPERKIGRCFTRRINGYVPTFEEGWQLVLSKGYGEEWYEYALSYFNEYAKKSATSSSNSTQTEQTNALPLQS